MDIRDDQKTTDLKTIVQEITDRPGWLSGNSMSFIVNGTGQSIAESYDGDEDKAPLLTIQYTTEGSILVVPTPLNGTDVIPTPLNGTSTVVMQNVTATLSHDDIEIGKIVNWEQIIQLDENSVAAIEIPADAENIKVEQIRADGETAEIVLEEIFDAMLSDDTAAALNATGITTTAPLEMANMEGMTEPTRQTN